ncbi:MAG TPA: YidC/Oxa1 family membrane protein insertase [Chloroflexota bacterium]|nr:YidC/Oxa1 family membrane protein insertase [Chloroflexota bacterium]
MNPFDIFLPIWNPLLGAIEGGLRELALVTGSGGLAIILFTVLLKLVLLPLSLMQTKSMKAMQAIQPELAQLRKKHGKDRERMAQEQMRLYKEHGVNPAAGCLPMLPMMFVLIGLYQALNQLANSTAESDHFFRDRWLWIQNLNQPDIAFHIPGQLFNLPDGIPVPGVLPIVMLITQVLYGKMTPTSGPSDDPQQQMMQRMQTYFMPLFLFYISFQFSAGLVLYWVVSNLFEILRMGFTVGWDPIKPAALGAGLGGGLGLAARFGGNGATRSASAEADDPPSEGVNPPPRKPPSGSRRKKGKRGGKR